MAKPAVKARSAGWTLLVFFLFPGVCAGALLESRPIPTREVPLFSTDELPFKPLDEEEKPQPLSPHRGGTFWEFLSERTQIGYGTDQVFNDNILLQDNRRREDLISTIEGVLAFYDPRGALLYGSQWEVNAFRYMKSNANAINHDVVSFVDWDPGGRYQLHFTHVVQSTNDLVFGAPGIDLLRRSTDFQKSVVHTFEPRLKFYVNEDDTIVAKGSYSLFDDQTKDDAASDRDVFKFTLDWDHAVTRTWNVYGGSVYRDEYVPGDKLKNVTALGGRLGTRYQLTQNESFEFLMEVDRPKTRRKEPNTDLNYSMAWSHLLGPRASFKLGLTDARRTSFVAGRSEFRSRSPNLQFNYELTPLVKPYMSGLFEKQKSSSDGGGTGGGGEVHKLWQVEGGFKWQVREQLSVTFSYSHKRSATRDFTNRILSFGFEGTF